MTWTPTRPSAAVRAGVSVAALAASGALLMTACSSSSSGAAAADAKPSGSASGSPAASGRGGAQAMDAYRQCLQQHGLNLPTFQRRSPGQGGTGGRPSGRPSGRPGGGTGGRGGFGGFPGFGGASPDAATQKALDACQSLRPQFNGQGRGGNGNSSAFQAFASCLKDHGVTLATPSPGATNRGGGFGGLRGLNTSDPKTAKAYDTCKALLPQRPSGTPTTTPTATT